MLNWIMLGAVTALIVLVIGQRLGTHRRGRRRVARRARRKAYASLWDQVMMRPRIKRITASPRVDGSAEERRRAPR